MTADQLRKSILQQAIQGKLVAQDPNDEPASILLECIREEKERLVKEKKIKKDKNPSIIFRGDDNSHYEKFALSGEIKCIDDEIPFELPKGWEWCRLGDVGFTITGSTPPKNNSDYFGSYIFFIGPGNIQNLRIINKTQGLSKLGLKYGTVAPINSILQVCIGGSIGKTAITDGSIAFNQQINSITPILCIVKFIHYILQSNYFQLSIINKSTGTATPIINRANWENIIIPIPPLAEQKRIVDKIEELMPLIEQYGKAQSELEALNSNIREQLKKSILQYAIEGKLVPQSKEDGTAEELLAEIQAEKQRLYDEGKLKKKDLAHRTIFKAEDNKYFEKKGNDIICIDDEIPFEIPKGWKWTRMGEIALMIGGYAFPSESIKGDFGVRVIRISDFNEKEWVNKSVVRYGGTENLNQYEIHIKDLLLAMTGGTVGKSFFVQNLPEKMYLNQRVAIIRTIKILPNYINTFLKSSFITDLICDKKKSTNDNISMMDIKSFLVPLPPLAEQKRIVDNIEELMTIIEQ